MKRKIIAGLAGVALVVGAGGCDGDNDRRSGCKPSPKAMSQVLVKPGPGGGRPGGGAKGGGAKPVKPKGGTVPKNGTNGGVPVGCR